MDILLTPVNHSSLMGTERRRYRSVKTICNPFSGAACLLNLAAKSAISSLVAGLRWKL